MASRFDTIPAGNWRWIGLAFRLLSEDLAAVEDTVASGSSGGTGSGVITSGPYVLDPNRAPVGAVVAIPQGTPVLTHVGTRMLGTTAGAALSSTTQPRGTVTLTKAGTGTAVWEDTGLFGECLRITTSTVATEAAYITAPIAAGSREVQAHAIVRLTDAPTADTGLFSITHTGSSTAYANAWLNKGATAGTVRLIASIPGAGWAYTSPDVPVGRFRLAIGVKAVDGANTSAVQVGFWSVADNGTETQIGTTYTKTDVAADMTGQTFNGVRVGKLSTQASLEGKPILVDAVRIATGAGAYGAGLLKAEALYPEAV